MRILETIGATILVHGSRHAPTLEHLTRGNARETR
jgi:hypothetical protein